MGRRTVAVIALTVWMTGVAAQSPPPAGTRVTGGAISGVVKDGVTGQPLAGVLIELRAPGGMAPLATLTRVVSDERGRFVFRELPGADVYTLHAMRPDYVAGVYGQLTMHGPSGRIALKDGEWFPSADITLWRPASISGRLVDERGEAVVGAWVRVLARVTVAGEPQWFGGPSVRTDDRGDYRIAGLVAGLYTVVVPSPSYTVAADAPGIFGVPTPEPMAGMVVSMPGAPRTDAALGEVHGFRSVIGNYVTPPVDLADGRARVYPTTFYPGVDRPDAAQTVPLALGEDRRGVDVALRPASAVSVSGRVTGPPEAFKGLLLRLMIPGVDGLVTGGDAATTLVAADGTFVFLRVPPGDYVLDAPSSLLEFAVQGGLAPQRPPSAPGYRIGGSSSGALASGPPGTTYQRLSTATRPDGSWVRQPVSVGEGGVSGLHVVLSPARTLRGRFEYVATTRGTIESTPVMGVTAGGGSTTTTITSTPRPSTQPIIRAEPASGQSWLGMPGSSPAPPDADQDVFTIPGVLPGEYVFRIATGAGRYTMQSVTIDGADYTHRPVDVAMLPADSQIVITLTDRVITLAGEVVGDGGAAPSGMVVVFPADRREWRRFGLSPVRLVSVPLGNASTFSFANIPAGDYLVAALDTIPAGAWQEPPFLEKVAGVATAISLDWGETRQIQLRQVRVR